MKLIPNWGRAARLNDTPFIRETFAAFEIQEVETTWTISSAGAGRGTKVTELIIRNRA